MAYFTKVAKVTDISPGQIKTVAVNGKMVALANVDGEFFAMSDICTHAQCSLGSEGFLDGGVVVCGCHGSQFDSKTGKVRSLPATQDLQTYPLKIDGNDVLIQL